MKKIKELLALRWTSWMSPDNEKILTDFFQREGKAYLRWRLHGNKGETDYVNERWGADRSLWELHTAVFNELKKNGYILEEQHLRVTTSGINFANERIQFTPSQLDVLVSPYGVYHDNHDIKLMIILGYMRGGFLIRHLTEAGREYLDSFSDPSEGKVDELVKEIIQKELEQQLARLTTGITPSLGHEKKPFYECEFKDESEVAKSFLAKVADLSCCCEPIDWENIDLCTPAVKTLSVVSYDPPTGLVTLSDGRVRMLHPEQIAKFEAMVMETPDLSTPPTNDVSIASYNLSTGDMGLSDGTTLTIDTSDLSVTVSDSDIGGGLPPCEKLYDEPKGGGVLRYNQGTGKMQWFDPSTEKKEAVTTATDELPMRKLTITMVEDHEGLTWKKEVVSRRNPSGGEFLELIYPKLEIELSIAQVAEGVYTVTELDQDGPLPLSF